MLRSRLSPCLLMKDNGLVKTKGFLSDKYVGDPLNAVRIFNEKCADELFVLDIGCTVNNSPPNFHLISKLAAECRMPLCYGGGVKSVDDAKRLVDLGVEKIAISSLFVENPDLIGKFVDAVGAQSIVGVLDVKAAKGFFRSGFDVYTHNGSVRSDSVPDDLVTKFQLNGIGEIVINSIDRDGTQLGYDFDLLDLLRPKITVPVTFIGGASSLGNIAQLYQRYGICGAGVGSLFVFKGKFKAVLINYPDYITKCQLF